MPATDVTPDPENQDDTERTGSARGRAGCLWQLLVEPWVIFGLTLAAVLFGRAYLVRRARRLRAATHREDADD